MLRKLYSNAPIHLTLILALTLLVAAGLAFHSASVIQQHESLDATDFPQAVLVLVVLGLLMGLLVAWLLGNLVLLSRVNRLVNLAEQVGAGDLTARSKLAYGRSDLGRLAQAIDMMAALLQERQSEAELAATALAEREELFRAVFECARDIMIVVDDEGRILDVNFNDIKAVNLTREDLLKLTLIDLAEDGQTSLARQRWLDRLANGGSGGEYEMVNTRGEHVSVEFTLRMHILPGRHLLLIQDVTERKCFEAASRQAEQDYRGIFENAHDAIVVIDPEDETVLDANERAFKVYGFPAAEFIGMSLQSISKDIANGRLRVQETLDKNSIVAFETVQYRKDGSAMLLEINASTISYQGRRAILSISRDATQRKRAEAALRESEERYRSLIEISPDAIIMVDMSGKVVLSNQMAATLHGYAGAEQMLGKNMFGSIAPEDLPYAYERMGETLTAGRSDTFELMMWREDGSQVPMEMRASLVRGSDEQPEGMIAVARDITERRRVEQERLQQDLELRETKIFLENIIATSPEIIFRSGPDWVFSYVSPNIERIIGYTREQALVPGFWLPKIHPDDNPPMYVEHELVMREHLLHNENEYRFLHADGNYRWFYTILSYQWDEQGNLLAIQGSVQDNTARKQAEEALRASESRFRSVFENGLNSIFILDSTGRVLDVNNAAADLAGVPVAEMRGKPYLDYIQMERQTESRQIWQILLTTGEYRGEGQITRRDGQMRDVEYHLKANFVPGQHLGVLNDITERKRSEEAQQARDAAEEANRAKSDFLSRMSHELRTPLNAILGFGQLLEMDELSTEQHENVDYILKGGKHLLGLINEVLDIARIEAGRMTLSPEPISARDVITESLELVGPMTAARNIKLVDTTTDIQDYYIMADKQRLKQVMLNLLSNAAKYNRDGGHIYVECQLQPGGRLRIAVMDNGMGITAADAARLFVPFERLGAEQTAIEGTGLGLALSKGLVEAMGGSMGMTSTPGIGSTFWLELAIAEYQVSEWEQERPDLPAQPVIQAPQRTVLYIEDNISNLRLIENVLERSFDIKLLSAMQGGLGLDLAYQQQPDLILLDLHLPDMPGIDLLQRLQMDPRTSAIPVVVISADATPRQIERLLAAGAYDYLTKPLDIKRLVQLLQTVLYSMA